jgi:hypothetical protein
VAEQAKKSNFFGNYFTGWRNKPRKVNFLVIILQAGGTSQEK